MKALSIKQPWATLLVHGRKTIEVRRWQLHYRGPLLIHAARIPDSRPEARQHVPPELEEDTQQFGGIIGIGRLHDCKVYHSLSEFVADQASHLNDPSWFEPTGLFGLCFRELRVLPFHRVKGNVKLFEVDVEDLGMELAERGSHQPGAPATGESPVLQSLAAPANLDGPGLLISVRNRAEADAALAGGATIIDVKEPDNGALGRADRGELAGVLATVAGRRPVSAALGELPVHDPDLPKDLASLSFIKWGLAGWRERKSAWKDRLQHLREQVESESPCRVVAVAYADWKLAGAPPWLDVARFTVANRFSVLLIDTWRKDGRCLLDWISVKELEQLRTLTRGVGVKLALAGSLNEAKIRELASVAPDLFAVRGAACTQGRRDGSVESLRVREFVELIESTGVHRREE